MNSVIELQLIDNLRFTKVIYWQLCWNHEGTFHWWLLGVTTLQVIATFSDLNEHSVVQFVGFDCDDEMMKVFTLDFFVWLCCGVYTCVALRCSKCKEKVICAIAW